MLKLINNISSILILVLLPLSIGWWLFAPFSLLTIFVSRNIYSTVIAAFILDLVTLGRYPLFLAFALALAVLFVLLRDRMSALS